MGPHAVRWVDRLASSWFELLISDCTSFVEFRIGNVIRDVVVKVLSVELRIRAILRSLDVIEAVLLVADETYDERFEDFKVNFLVLELRLLAFRQVSHLAWQTDLGGFFVLLLSFDLWLGPQRFISIGVL